MTSKKDELISLRELVKTDKLTRPINAEQFFVFHSFAYGSHGYAPAAYLGSIAAAKSLHMALFGTANVQLVSFNDKDDYWSVTINPNQEVIEKTVGRAWLLAIIEALILRVENEQ